MADLTAMEKLERARKSIMVAEERLSVVNKRIPELNNELEELIVINETQGYKGRTIEKTQTEIDALLKEKVTLKITINALKKKLPELERESKIEIASTETFSEYQKALLELKGLLADLPSLEVLKNELEKIQNCFVDVEVKQQRFFSVSKDLSKIMVEERVDNLSGVTIESLKADRANIDYQELLVLADELLDFNEQLNRLQYNLFAVATLKSTDKDYALNEIIKGNIEPEYSSCGNYKITYEGNTWFLWKKQMIPSDTDFGFKESWRILSESMKKPEFPCDHKQLVTKKEPELKPLSLPGKLVYNNETVKMRDPDIRFVEEQEKP